MDWFGLAGLAFGIGFVTGVVARVASSRSRRGGGPR